MFFDFYGSIWYCLTRTSHHRRKKCCVTQKTEEKSSNKTLSSNRKESEAINMYERIEKCGVKGKDFFFGENHLGLNCYGGGGARKRRKEMENSDV
jgi:hypothetical protein